MSTNCFHCGEDLPRKPILFDQKEFCCSGCKTVYQLLSDNNLGEYYNLESKPGTKPEGKDVYRFAFLNVDEIRKKFIDFEDDKHIHVTLYLPQIHCSSCIYLLENLSRIDPGVVSCQVDFAKRTARIVFNKNLLSFENLALLLDRIGYAPNFSSHKEVKRKRNFQYLYKLGVAGFAFGSIMLWTFPEYLGVSEDNPEFRNFTAYLSFLVSIPVLLYSANEYLISAYKTVRQGGINLDVPISIGIIALYYQSSYTIFSGEGPGYMDSFAGFIFFLLIGKWFQSKTYESLSFERDYTAYFPVAVTRIVDGKSEIVEIDQLKIGDTIQLRNEEVIPSDSILLSERTNLDYSFVTGESETISRLKNDFIYAGGRIKGDAVLLQVEKESSRSHLTQLWNEAASNKGKQQAPDKLSAYFLIAVLLIAGLAGSYHFLYNSASAVEIVVAVLIVACPCALALSKPFTYGNIMRQMGRKGLYLKNTSIIPSINQVQHIVFDKTGTLTKNDPETIQFIGDALSSSESTQIASLTNNSTHPLSQAISKYFLKTGSASEQEESSDFQEVSGQGIAGIIRGQQLKLGSASYVGFPERRKDEETASHVSIDGEYRGKFVFSSSIREGVVEMIGQLKNRYNLHVLSGDQEKDRTLIEQMIPNSANIHFSCSPRDKSDYILNLQKNGDHVLMIGDGLNDAGALENADVGIAVSEDMFRFTPSSDAIITADRLAQLDRFLRLSNYASTVLRICYVFSLTYNIVGLSFAVSGNLTPLIAAILMPLSSITIVAVATFSTLFRRW